MQVWEEDLSTKAESTREVYYRYFNRFLKRWSLTPDELYEKRRADLAGDDPRDRQGVERMIKVQMAEMVEQGFSASTCDQLLKAMSSFFDSQGLPISLKSKDKPKGVTNGGQRLALRDHITKMYDHVSDENRLKSRALLMVLKDTGLRVSDVSALDLGDYWEAQDVEIEGLKFKVLDPKATQKTGAPAITHLGPESIRDIEAYLEERKEKGEELTEETPLFLDRKSGRASSTSLSMILVRLAKKIGAKGISAHSFRKRHTTLLESAGVPENWIKKLQGKAVGGSMGPYSRPEELLNGEGETLTDKFVASYDTLKVFDVGASEQQVKDQADRIKDLDAKVKLLEAEKAQAENGISKVFDLIDRMNRRIEELEKKENS